jgi:hypothetical protein
VGMTSRLRPEPANFERCRNFLCKKIEAVALREGASDGDCGDLEAMLAAMPPAVRDRVKMVLEGTEIQTEFDEPVMAFAARYLLTLAKDIWEANPHPLSHSSAEPTNRRRWN